VGERRGAIVSIYFELFLYDTAQEWVWVVGGFMNKEELLAENSKL